MIVACKKCNRAVNDGDLDPDGMCCFCWTETKQPEPEKKEEKK